MEVVTSLSPMFFLLTGFGVLIGIVFGAIPGMTATMALAVCLPVTYSLGLQEGLALLLGLYVGGITGGLIPAVLLNIPGTPSSIATTFDGYPMTQKGEGELAMKVSIVSSLVGGLFSALVLFLFAPFLSSVAIKFSYVEKFLIIVLSLSVIASLSKHKLMGILSGMLGMILSLVGTYDITKGGNGQYRLMFSWMEDNLSSGFSLLPVLVGLFAITKLFEEMESSQSPVPTEQLNFKHGTRFSLSIFKGRFLTLGKSSLIGTFVGMLPGIGGSAASVLAYTQEKNMSPHPETFGKGSPVGLMASESSNNALTGGALIPLVSLGIPGDSTTAVLIAAFTLQGVQIGPLFISEHHDIWLIMMSALVMANLIMFVVMFTSIRQIAKLVLIPRYLLYPFMMLMCVIGSYAINHGVMFDVWTLLIFGLFGYLGQKIGLEIIPLVIGFILGPSAEIYFVKSIESYGDMAIFFTKSPIAIILWVLIVISLLMNFKIKNRKSSSSSTQGETHHGTSI